MSIKTKLEKTALYLRNARNAVIGRGGEISATAGFKDLPDAITNIPNDQTLAWQTVESNSKRVTVPSGVLPMAQIKKIGGMSYKSNNILKLKTLNETQNGVTITTNPDGSYTLNGTVQDVTDITLWDASVDYPYTGVGAGKSICIKATGLEDYSYFEGVDENENRWTASNYLWVASNYIYNEEEDWDKPDIETDVIGGGGDKYTLSEGYWLNIIFLSLEPHTTFNNVTFTIMVNEGTTYLPYEPYFEGIRDSKTKSIVSEGANKVKVLGWSATGIYGDKTALSLTNNHNTTLNTTEAVNRVEVTQSNWVEGGGYSSPNGEFNGKLSKTLTAGKTYIFSADVELTHCPLNQPNLRVSIDNNVMFAFYSLKLNTKIRVSKSFVYIPSEYDICRLYFSLNGNSIVLSDIMITEQEVTDTNYKPFVGTLGITNIPEAVRNLEGYGLGINADYYNYVEWRDGRCYFGQTCKKLVFDGTEQWKVIDGSTPENRYFEVYLQKNAVNQYNPIMSEYERKSIFSYTTDIGWHLFIGTDIDTGIVSTHLNIRPYNVTTECSTLNSWKTYLAERYANGNPLTFIYALAEPIETDITDLMTVDNHIAVEGGGTIEFNNEYGCDIPNEINYLFNTAGG